MTKKQCQKKCKLDSLTNTCLGCGRTIQEIIDAGNAHTKNETKSEASGDVAQVDGTATDPS